MSGEEHSSGLKSALAAWDILQHCKNIMLVKISPKTQALSSPSLWQVHICMLNTCHICEWVITDRTPEPDTTRAPLQAEL